MMSEYTKLRYMKRTKKMLFGAVISVAISLVLFPLFLFFFLHFAVFTTVDDYIETDGLKYNITDDMATVVSAEDYNDELIIPDSVDGYPVVAIGRQAFINCSELKSVSIPDSVISIESQAFYGCTGLKEITIPSGVSTIKVSAFYGCTGLTSIIIPDSVTCIEDYAFYGCTSLTNIVIPESVTSIGENSFYDCPGYKK